jgi:hypothetical protein
LEIDHRDGVRVDVEAALGVLDDAFEGALGDDEGVGKFEREGFLAFGWRSSTGVTGISMLVVPAGKTATP